MTTTTPNFTIGVSLVALQAIAANAELVSGEVALTKLSGYVFIHFGRTSTVAPTDPNGNPAGVTFRVEGAAKGVGAGEWFPLQKYTTNASPAVGSSNTSSTGAAQTVGSTSGFNNGDVVVVQDNTTANSEWAHVKSVTSTIVLTMEENLVNSHATGTTYNQAEIITLGPIDLGGISRLRLVVDGSKHNQPFLCEAFLSTLDSLTTV